MDMIKKIVTWSLLAICFTAQASYCPQAEPASSPGFCESFKAVAACHCTSRGIPAGMCKNLQLIYSRMVGTFGSLQNACDWQSHGTSQECVEDWNCYLQGGFSSTGPCSGTGHSCV